MEVFFGFFFLYFFLLLLMVLGSGVRIGFPFWVLSWHCKSASGHYCCIIPMEKTGNVTFIHLQFIYSGVLWFLAVCSGRLPMLHPSTSHHTIQGSWTFSRLQISQKKEVLNILLLPFMKHVWPVLIALRLSSTLPDFYLAMHPKGGVEGSLLPQHPVRTCLNLHAMPMQLCLRIQASR